MTQDERKLIEMALEALLHAYHEDEAHPKTLETITAIKEALAQPETPHEIGQRIAKTGGGISHLWSAVSQDDEIAEAERGFKEALAQPEQDWIERERAVGYREGHQNALKQMAQPEQEPCKTCNGAGEVETGIGMMVCDDCHGITYTNPPQRKEPEQEPVALVNVHEFYDNCTNFSLLQKLPKGNHALYTTPPQRKPLTSQERDAKRWRFLMENSYDSESVTQFHVWEHSWEPHSQTGEPTEWKQRVRGIALIDFIDRAIEAAHGIKE